MKHRNAVRIVHGASGAIALAIIVIFMSSTLLVEAFGSDLSIIGVKRAICRALPLLVLAMATAGATGFMLAGGSPCGPAAVKMARMKVIGPNGLLVLVPAAIFLSWKAEANTFDAGFYLVQGIEIIAGGINIGLLSLNMRDGLAMSSRRRKAGRQEDAKESIRQ